MDVLLNRLKYQKSTTIRHASSVGYRLGVPCCFFILITKIVTLNHSRVFFSDVGTSRSWKITYNAKVGNSK